jgi:hypothetical protein
MRSDVADGAIDSGESVMQHDEFELKFRANPTDFLRLEATGPSDLIRFQPCSKPNPSPLLTDAK